MYATLFDRNYLERGIVMVRSLLRYNEDAMVTVLCLDQFTLDVMREFSFDGRVALLPLEAVGSELLGRIAGDRSHREFCWTLGSVLCSHVLHSGAPEVVYLDADICFFSSARSLLDESRSGDVAALRHRFPERLRGFEVNGLFNVQWVYFKGSATGIAAAERWAGQCVNRCTYDPDAGFVGDQKYLDEWPSLYPTFVDLQIGGAGVAPWNHESMEFERVGAQWQVGGDVPLVFYHFHGLTIEDNGKVTLSGSTYSEVRQLPKGLYAEYLDMLRATAVGLGERASLPDPSLWWLASESWGIRIISFVRSMISRTIK
jgi:hypothetical protein